MFSTTFILVIVLMILSFVVGHRFKKKFQKYSEQPLSAGLSGREIAAKMLQDSGIHDVKIQASQGQLSDHYNPSDKTVNLSPEVYQGRSVAAAAVAAHECGHAIQHAQAYSFLQLRSAMVPAVNISNKFVPWLLIGGIFMVETFPHLLLAGIVLFAISTLFSFVTLPVEFDASKRALQWLNGTGITSGKEHNMVQDALKGAAMTYVMAALSSLAVLMHYALAFLGAQD